MQLSGITREVADLEISRQFYEEILGFERGAFYEPTLWQSYKVQEGVFFATGKERLSYNEICFVVDDVEALWAAVKERVEVVCPLEHTPWGSYRFLIKDPDGNVLAFGAKQD